jgi:hypothetical protein
MVRQIVAGHASGGKHVPSALEAARAGKLRYVGLGEGQLAQQALHAPHVLGRTIEGVGPKTERQRQNRQDDGAEQDAESQLGHRFLEVAEEPHDADLRHQDHAQSDCCDGVKHRAGRQLDLVVPQPRHHLPHHDDVDDRERVPHQPVNP